VSVWTRWAAAQGAAYKLSLRDAHVLTVMAGVADTGGVVRRGVAALAQDCNGCSYRTVERAIARLEQLGLVTTVRRGSQVAERLLNRGVVPVEQPRADRQMDMLSTGPNNGRLRVVEERPRPIRQSANPPIRQPANPTLGVGSDPTPKGVGGRNVNGAAAAESAGAPARRGVVSATLDEVLAVLDGTPDMALVDPLAVDSMLRAHPERDDRPYDHVAAAHTVDAMKRQGTWTDASPTRLLQRALLDQADRAHRVLTIGSSAPAAPKGQRPAKPWDGALRRALEARDTEVTG